METTLSFSSVSSIGSVQMMLWTTIFFSCQHFIDLVDLFGRERIAPSIEFDVHCDGMHLVAMFLLQLHEMRKVRDAMASPSRPQIEDHDFSAVRDLRLNFFERPAFGRQLHGRRRRLARCSVSSPTCLCSLLVQNLHCNPTTANIQAIRLP